ncbi:MAG: RidA family protein, partial [Micavibrio sp.]
MDGIAAKLKEWDCSLPEPAAPAANYVPYTISGTTLYIAGQIPFLNGERAHIGKLGKNMGIEDGQRAARACALNILAQALHAVGD